VNCEALAVDWAIENPLRLDPIIAQRDQKRCGLPVSVRDLGCEMPDAGHGRAVVEFDGGAAVFAAAGKVRPLRPNFAGNRENAHDIGVFSVSEAISRKGSYLVRWCGREPQNERSDIPGRPKITNGGLPLRLCKNPD
jgi:hypothetical protein